MSQGVTCCSSTPLSPAQVSAASTPHPSTIAQLPRVLPHPQTCSGLTPSLQTITCAYILSPFDRSRSTRDDARFHQGEAADGFTVRHKRQPRSSSLGAQLSRSARRSRRIRRCGSLTHTPVWAALSSARFRLARGLIGDPAAASAAAAVGPPPMAVDRAIQLTGGGGLLQLAPVRSRPIGRPRWCGA